MKLIHAVTRAGGNSASKYGPTCPRSRARRMRLVTQPLVLNCQPESQGSVASLSSYEEAHWIGSDDNVGQRGLGLLGFGLASDAEALEFGAIMMKRTVAWAADNTPRDKVPDRLEEDVRLQDGRYKRLVQWSPESRAQRSPNMIVYRVTYETDN